MNAQTNKDMTITTNKPLETELGTYTSVVIKSGKTDYTFQKVVGKINRVSVYKNNTPFLSTGKDFLSFDEAQQHYKNPKLKTMILMAETALA